MSKSKFRNVTREYFTTVEEKKSDIISSPMGEPINLQRFIEFLNNINNGIKDCIRTINYTFEGEVTISAVCYDGKIIKVDQTSYSVIFPEEKKVITSYIGTGIGKYEENGFIVYYLHGDKGQWVTRIYNYKTKFLK